MVRALTLPYHRAMAFHIRLSRPDDAARLPAVERSAGAAFRAIALLAHLADGPDHSIATHRAHIAAGLSWVATDDADSPIGFVIAEHGDDTLHIVELAVRRERQKAGCGRALMEAAIAWARAQKLSAVTLTTFRDVPWNAPFYARMGFEILAGAAIGPHLEAQLRREAARGLAGRCAMRLDLAAERDR
jgi:GNAT superfamily N-acetyltransferase